MTKECWICGNKEIIKMFTNTKGKKHYYCKRCGEKYIIKIPKNKPTQSQSKASEVKK